MIFLGGTVLAFTLPHKVDSAKGERKARLVLPHEEAAPAPPPRTTKGGRSGSTKAGRRNGREKPPGLRSVGPSVLHGLQANAAHRALSGFLIFFLAFLLREHPWPGRAPPSPSASSASRPVRGTPAARRWAPGSGHAAPR